MVYHLPPARPRSPRLFPPRSSKSVPAGLILLAVLVAALATGGAFFALTQKTVTVSVDGQATTVRTRQATVGGLLDELALALAPQDDLRPARDVPLENGATIHVLRAQGVVVEADGQATTLYTLQRAPLVILAQAGVRLGSHDLLLVDGAVVPDPGSVTFPAPPTHVRVLRAVTLTVDDDGDVYTVHTTAPTVGEALHAQGMTLYLADAVTPDLGAPVADGLRVTIRRSVPLTVQVGDVTVHTRTRAATVAGALAEVGLPLVGEDYSLPPPEAPLPADGAMRVVRVSEEVQIEQELIPYDTIYRADATLLLDEQRVLQGGVPGVAERRTRLRYEDGVEVSRVEEPLRVAQQPVDEIIAYGTRIVIRTVQTPDGPLEYWRVIPMLATSYSPATSSRPSDAPNYGIASTGVPVERGIVAIDPDVIPYSTRVYVPGYGVGLAADTGGAINGRRIDLGYSDDDLELWYGWVDVYLLPPVPEPQDIRYVLP